MPLLFLESNNLEPCIREKPPQSPEAFLTLMRIRYLNHATAVPETNLKYGATNKSNKQKVKV